MLKELTELSNLYGNDPEFVLAGGGNTSWKTEESLYVKPSGIPLATIEEGDFVKLDRRRIDDVFSFVPPEDPVAREEAVKRLMAAAVDPSCAGRPSVEAPLHHAMGFDFVVHLHPAKVNAMTCGKNGAVICSELFPKALWVPCCDPGYTLAVKVRNEIAEFAEANGEEPSVIFLQNHGVFVGADSKREIIDIYSNIMDVIDEYCAAMGIDASTPPSTGAFDEDFAFETAPLLRSLLAPEGGGRRVVLSAPFFEPAGGALTPDHIVYAGSYALRVDAAANIADEVAGFADERGCPPKVVAVPGKAVFCAAESLKSAETTLALAKDAARVAKLAEAFGGAGYLDDDRRAFIENWEVESYRKKAAAGSANGELTGKVAVVTGGAQGFGLGISEGLLERGAIVALADMNEEGARKAAAELSARFGERRAFALAVDISDEASVEAMTRRLVLECGGLDILVANAGVLRAGSVKTFERAHWDFVTNINYTGYFLCVKHLSKVMALQNSAGGEWTDIVQINSKSGLVGSNRNAAYAASKFGTIGMTQSFALELVDDRIKVNSVCPGNFFDGPLWSDPDKGLFVQYLNSGKVPGAKTVEDVKRFYESKVPMGRGCLPSDVVKAIVYCVLQEYETGQAIPVAGGQVMLN